MLATFNQPQRTAAGHLIARDGDLGRLPHQKPRRFADAIPAKARGFRQSLGAVDAAGDVQQDLEL
jgi:hypothetical protein